MPVAPHILTESLMPAWRSIIPQCGVMFLVPQSGECTPPNARSATNPRRAQLMFGVPLIPGMTLTFGVLPSPGITNPCPH